MRCDAGAAGAAVVMMVMMLVLFVSAVIAVRFHVDRAHCTGTKGSSY